MLCKYVLLSGVSLLCLFSVTREEPGQPECAQAEPGQPEHAQAEPGQPEHAQAGPGQGEPGPDEDNDENMEYEVENAESENAFASDDSS